jgi:hypothetical protein
VKGLPAQYKIFSRGAREPLDTSAMHVQPHSDRNSALLLWG